MSRRIPLLPTGLLALLVATPLTVRGDEESPLSEKLESIGKYAESILRATRAKQEESGLKVSVSAVPDAYLYTLALEMGKIGKAGYDDDRTWRELRKLPRAHRKLRGKLLLIVEAETERKSFYFLQKKPEPHLLEQKSNKTFRITETKPRPSFLKWQVFQYPPDSRRLINRVLLCRLKKMSWVLSSSTVKLTDDEPFTYTFQHVARHDGVQKSFNSGVNESTRQISCITWRGLMLPPMQFEFFPGKWKVPGPPETLKFILARIESS